MFFLISFFWFIRTSKAILFWLYLWQIKEYRFARFINHFQTAKGKQLIFNKLLIFKILLVIIFLSGFFFRIEILLPFFIAFPFLILILYILETAKVVFDFFKNKLKIPVLTKKIIALIFITLTLQVLFIAILSLYLKNEIGRNDFVWASFSFLLFDILTPVIVSIIILFFQPLVILFKNQIIKQAKRKRKKFKNLKVIAVVGSYGKTSIKEFLAAILSTRFKILKTKEHQNTDPALAQHILNKLNSKHQIFIAEIAAYSRGGIKSACDIIKPQIGIIAGVNEQHLALFGSMENLMSAEGGKELIDSLPKHGCVIILNKRKDLEVNHLKSQIFCSVKEKLDFWAEDIKVKKDYLVFKICSKKQDPVLFKVNLIGAQNVENILLAVACAKELGMSLAEIAKACKKIRPLEKTMQIKKGINNSIIIDDSYSANPDGVIAALDYLKTLRQAQNKLIIIMPCLIELGPATQKVHQKIGKKIGQVCDLAIITTKEMFKEIKRAATEIGMDEKNILFMENPKEIFTKIKSFSQPNDVILLEGRLSAELIKQLVI